MLTCSVSVLIYPRRPRCPGLIKKIQPQGRAWSTGQLNQWRIQGRGPGGPARLIFRPNLKNVLETSPPPPPYLSVWMTWTPPPPLRYRSIQLIIYLSVKNSESISVQIFKLNDARSQNFLTFFKKMLSRSPTWASWWCSHNFRQKGRPRLSLLNPFLINKTVNSPASEIISRFHQSLEKGRKSPAVNCKYHSPVDAAGYTRVCALLLFISVAFSYPTDPERKVNWVS